MIVAHSPDGKEKPTIAAAHASRNERGVAWCLRALLELVKQKRGDTLTPETAGIIIQKLTLGPYETNAYLVGCSETGQAIVIDAPGSFAEFSPHVRGRDVKFIALTHTHPDHVQSLKELRHETKAPLAMHSAEADQVTPPPEKLLEGGETISVGNLQFKVVHTPGHTPGGICLLCGEHLFSGDTLFPGGPGKTFQPAQFRQIVDSITKKLFLLLDDTLVHPGHGTDTVLEKEKAEFAAFAGRPHPDDICGDVLWLTS